MSYTTLWILRLLAVAALTVEVTGLVTGDDQMLNVGFLAGMAVVAIGWALSQREEGDQR
ncbi:hypothetical protein ABTX62_36165 [Streptomyces sp. NPDC096046]|uniref:hypothetical protein n=1 Tax=Streptomyces sp. NPDC096046 TaxID=3155542 RepID=UPI0033306B61